MPRRTRVVTANDQPQAQSRKTVVVTEENPHVENRLTQNEIRARAFRKYATTTSMGGYMKTGFGGGDIIDSGSSQFYSPQLSTDFLEKPQNLRERRAFYRFFYNTNELVGQAIDIHSTLPLSKLRLVPPKGKNKHQNEYVFKFFQTMCEDMKLFKTLIEGTHEYFLFGNCTGKSAEINELHGITRADKIKVGDFILTDKGRYRRVLKVGSRESDSLIKIKCYRDFRDIPVTDEHPIEILRDNKFIFEKAGNIKLGDYIRVTWPEEIEDIKNANLKFSENYEIYNDGVVLNFKVPHPRNSQAYIARKKILSWVNSLIEPVVISRKELAISLDIDLMTFNNVLFNMERDFPELNFHKQFGAKGWQNGSQVVWFHQDTTSIEVTDSYTIYKSIKFPSIQQLKIDNDLCYLAGYWLGDGTLGSDYSRDTWGRGLWQICFKNTCHENINRIESILKNIFGLESVTKWDDSNGMTTLRVISNPAFVEWWSDNFGRTSLGKVHGIYKKIPIWFVNLPLEKLQYFLAGVLDSDGCVTGCKTQIVEGNKKRPTQIIISMISRHIMDSVRDIALKCGMNVSYGKKNERPVITPLPRQISMITREMFTVSCYDKDSCDIITKFSNKKVKNDAFYSKNISSIRTEDGKLAYKVKRTAVEDYNDLVYNFEVEEDHTYQVAGFSTHNCFFFAEEEDWKDNMDPHDVAKKKEEGKQRTEMLKEKYKISDKNPMYKGWKKLLILPPDQVRVRKLPLTDDVAIEYMPDPETRKFLTSDMPIDPADPARKLHSDISEDLKQKVRQSGVIPLDTDPNSGSHVYHLARKKSQYEPLGVSIIERCVNTLILMDKLRQAQTSIASRHMTPMRIVWADQLSDDDVDNLREQVDLALVDPDFSIIANYEVHWEEMGSQGRLLDVTAESEDSMNRIFAGLGVTREILTGEGTYTGSKISLEIMNNMYLLFREQLQDYVENYLFKPVARKKGFIEYDDYGNEVLLYPRLSFTRLAIRDNEQFFDAAFQLYQKGSISVDLILDILNIDPDSTKEKIERDLFTVNDSIFNEVMRNIYTNVATPLVEQTDLTERLAKYMKLNLKEAEKPAEGVARFSSENGGLNSDHTAKLAKLMKYMKENPDKLDKLFQTTGTKP